jgi:hypothetical protein
MLKLLLFFKVVPLKQTRYQPFDVIIVQNNKHEVEVLIYLIVPFGIRCRP